MELCCQDSISNCSKSLLIMIWDLSANFEEYQMVHFNYCLSEIGKQTTHHTEISG